MIFMCVMEYGDKDAVARVRSEHRAYMTSLVQDGKVLAAGSFLPNGDGGLFLYEAASLEEAQRLVDNDPYIRSDVILSHRLTEYEIHGCNAALLRVLD